MSEYWKSQPKKFCDYCKCWITDNKPSIDFHEKGKKHQENVKRKIDDIKKKSLKNAQKQEEEESDMKKMEQAALAAFKKDLASDPELAAKYGVKVKTEAEKEEERKKKELEAKLAKQKAKEEAERKLREGIWYEAKSPEGYSYYWNSVTKEPVWVAPQEYVSLEEQEAEQKRIEEEAKKEAEEQARLKAELDLHVDEVQVGPLPRTTKNSAYGGWTTVQKDPDLELPQEPAVPEEPLPIEDIPLPNPPKEKKQEGGRFKEKRVKTLAGENDSSVVSFKKRKVTSGARNCRRREDSDD